MADYARAIEIDPVYAAPYRNRADLHFDKRDLARAIADYTHAIEIDAKFEAAYVGRAAAYELSQRNDEAIADYRQALAINAYSQNSLNALKRLGVSP
jgi:tetratricopeptide (TPR) repeat protein